MTQFTQLLKYKWYIAVAFVLLLQLVSSFLFDIVRVDAREVAVVTDRGQVTQVNSAGWYLKTPYITKHAATYDISTQNIDITADAATKDQQTVGMSINLQYKLRANEIENIFLKIGGNGNGGTFADDRVELIIEPLLQESTKSVSAQFTAIELLEKRDEVKNNITEALQSRLNDYTIDVIAVNIKNLDFSADFDKAIERKVVAQQQSEQAKFELEREKVELEKERVKAQQLEVRGQALKVNPEILEEKKIDKWDGKLPQVQGSDGIIIDLNR